MTKKVLVVDDDLEIHQQIKSFLKEKIENGQLSLYSAHDARSALSCILEIPEIDVLFLDILLPDTNGLLLLKELEKLEGIFSIVMLTSNQEQQVIIEALNHGAVGYLIKPVHPHELLTIMDRAIEQTDKKRLLLRHEVQNNFLRMFNERLQQEIQERKKFEEEVKILTAALEQSVESVFITDRSGKICYVNRGFTQVTGYSREEAIGKTPRILKSGKQSLEFYKKLWSCITSGHVFKGEFINRKKNGKLYWEEKIITPICSQEDEIDYFVSTGRDVTEKKRIERLREDTERIIRHDMKNPLHGIMGFAELLLENNLSQEQRQMVQYIREAAIELMQMLNNSLDIFKMEEGTYQLEKEPVDIVAVVQNTFAMLSQFAAEKKVTLTFEVTKTLPYVAGSARHLQNMCYNLLKNAIEASLPNQTVRIWLEHNLKTIVLKIWNHLPIPEEIRNRFFERYVTYGKKQGNGLGTYSARLVARAHGGDLGFTTSREDGTTLIATLPVWQE